MPGADPHRGPLAGGRAPGAGTADGTSGALPLQGARWARRLAARDGRRGGAPATFNTVNQWALGLTEKFVVGFAAEAIGKGVPLVTMPCVNAAYARHPQFARSLETLSSAGVRVLYGAEGFTPNPPGEGRPDAFPWECALTAAAEAVAAAPGPREAAPGETDEAPPAESGGAGRR